MPSRLTPADLGSVYTTADGRYALRFERRYDHPPAKVWRAITEPEQLRAWFPAVVEFDLTPGARLRFVPTDEQRRRYGMTDEQATTGVVTRVDPPVLLEYTWDREILRWELTPQDTHGCRLVFTNVFDDRAMAGPAGAGWHAGLEVVAAQLDGRPVDWSPWDRADELTSTYLEHIG
jgi:uncharacterized protein YndB with AHSA1/START domain